MQCNFLVKEKQNKLNEGSNICCKNKLYYLKFSDNDQIEQ